MMRDQYEKELNTLHTELTAMGGMCEEVIALAMKALDEEKPELIQQVFQVDSGIDRKERDIESLCLKLLLRQQPVAGDLRDISAALKMISDMERIGDQASDIAEITKTLLRSGGHRIDDLKTMAKEAISMVNGSVDAFLRRDLTLARQVIAHDDVVDNWFETVRSELISCVASDSGRGAYYFDLLMIAKYLERIADHATNIAEWVEYSITGARSKDGDWPG